MKVDQLKQILESLPDYKDNEDVKIRFHPYTMKRRFEPSIGKYRRVEIDGDNPDIDHEDDIKNIDCNYGWPGIFIEI